MSIAEQLSKTAQNLSNARQTILLKGGSVGDTPAFDNLASEIESIPSGDSNYVLVDDTDTAYRKTILAGADQYAKLKSLGGMTYKRHKPDGNLLPYPYIDNTDTQGTFIFNKISDDWLLYKTATLVNSTNAFKLPKGTYVLHLNHSIIDDSTQALYSPSGYVSINGNMEWVETGTGIPYATFTFDTETLISNIEVYMEWMVNMVVDNPIVTGSISPVLYREGEAVTFTPRQMELVDTKVKAIRSYGANLIPFPYYDITTTSNQGIDLAVDEDGTITINGTYNGAYTLFDYRLADIMYLPAGDYTVSGCEHGDINVRIFVWIKGGKADRYVSQFSGNISFKLNEGEYIHRLTLRIDQAVGTINNEVIKPMINLGTTATPYKPYREPITYIIPEALQGSGKGVAGHNDTVDFERGKDIKRVSTDILTGTEYTIYKPLPDTRPWLYYIGANTLNNPAVNKGLICNAFNASTSGWAEQTIGDIMITNHYLVFTWYPEKTADDFRAFLAERYANGDPVIVTYPIDPIETDLAETIGTIFKIEEGGFFEFVNDDGNAVPSHISYIRRLV